MLEVVLDCCLVKMNNDDWVIKEMFAKKKRINFISHNNVLNNLLFT